MQLEAALVHGDRTAESRSQRWMCDAQWAESDAQRAGFKTNRHLWILLSGHHLVLRNHSVMPALVPVLASGLWCGHPEQLPGAGPVPTCRLPPEAGVDLQQRGALLTEIYKN